MRCGLFRVDLSAERLWKESEAIELTPKAWALLRYLLERPGQLITKTELLDAIWGNIAVGEGSLTKVVFELRSAFGDTAQKPRFIETVHRRGFRFIATFEPTESPGQSQTLPEGRERTDRDLPFIGRDAEMRQLREWLALALRGERQIAFIVGEPGIGKTALVDEWIKQFAAPHGGPTVCLVATGQCIEQFGPREAFMPMLEALGRLCRQPGGERLVELLRRHAPTWLTEIPGLLQSDDREALQRQTLPVTPERMLRVMVEALEVMGAETPIVLVLEDLHWSDYSTLDLLSSVAQRREPARLMVIATYRPVDAIVQRHPVHEVRQALELHGRCRSLAIELLSPAAVLEYLGRRFARHNLPEALAQVLHRHTDGNPLFLLTAVDYLCTEGWITESDGVWQLTADLESVVPGVPETLRLLIERQYDKLEEEERLALDAASVAGHTIASPSVAAALEQDVAAVEAICNRLARRGIFLRQLDGVTWPDGTDTAQYRFVHSLYQRALYDRLAAEQRKRWHRRIGERLEAGFRGETEAMAAELVVHFERAGEREKSIRHLEQAARNASRRFADQEAMVYFERALQALALTPDTPERTQHELILLLSIGTLQLTTLGYGSKVARDTYARLLSLCRDNPAQPLILPAFGGLALYHLNKAELGQAQELGEQMLAAAERMPLPAEMLAYSRAPLLLALYYRGRLDEAIACMEQGVQLCDPTQYSRAPHVWSDHGVSMLGYLGIALVLRGLPDQALVRSSQAIERAQAIGLAGTIAHSYCFAAVMHYFLRDWRKVEELGARAVAVTEENGLRFWKSQALAIHGAGMAQLGEVDAGVASLRTGYAEMRAAGGIATGTYVQCMIAEAFIKAGRFDEADVELTEAFALAERTDERFAEAELCRDRGTIILLRAASTSAAGKRKRPTAARREPTDIEVEAESWFEKAIGVAQSQGAPWWELRATADLCRLWRNQGRRREAHERLARVYGKFSEGHSTVDLTDAATLLAELAT